MFSSLADEGRSRFDRRHDDEVYNRPQPRSLPLTDSQIDALVKELIGQVDYDIFKEVYDGGDADDLHGELVEVVKEHLVRAQDVE